MRWSRWPLLLSESLLLVKSYICHRNPEIARHQALWKAVKKTSTIKKKCFFVCSPFSCFGLFQERKVWNESSDWNIWGLIEAWMRGDDSNGTWGNQNNKMQIYTHIMKHGARHLRVGGDVGVRTGEGEGGWPPPGLKDRDTLNTSHKRGANPGMIRGRLAAEGRSEASLPAASPGVSLACPSPPPPLYHSRGGQSKHF